MSVPIISKDSSAYSGKLPMLHGILPRPSRYMYPMRYCHIDLFLAFLIAGALLEGISVQRRTERP